MTQNKETAFTDGKKRGEASGFQCYGKLENNPVKKREKDMIITAKIIHYDF